MCTLNLPCATSVRYTTLSCRRHHHYARSRSSEELDAATPLRSERTTCRTRRTSEPTYISAPERPFTRKKNNVSCKSGRSSLILDVAKHHRIATHYSRLSSLDAAAPRQKVPQHLHPSIAQCQQQHRKSHFETSVTAHGQSEQDSALKRRCPHPSHKQA